jgi:hypothetical protein
MAAESIRHYNTIREPMVHVGIFPNSQPEKLKELILSSQGVISVVFPPKSFAFTPLLALLGRRSMAKSYFASGVVIATFRSEFVLSRPSLDSTRHLHEWWALHAPNSLVSAARWPDPWWCLTGDTPIQGHFIPRWPGLDPYLRWANTEMGFNYLPASNHAPFFFPLRVRNFV